jgi:transposase
MSAPRKYPDELRERAVRLVTEDGQHGAIARVAARLDINPKTLRNWVRGDRRRVEQPEVVDLEEENKRLRRQVADLERDKEILKAASSFFARELDRPQRR